jgi:GT2 family glycosyltransferase
VRRRFTGELSVIIPCHGRHRLIADLLRLLEIQTLSRDRREILLVDDGSRPPLASRLPAALRKNVRILRLRSRRGPAAARNLALEKAGGRIVLFLNSDAVPSPDLLEAHLAAQNGGRENAAVLGRFDSHPSCADLFLRLCDLGELIFPYQRLRPGIVQPGNFFWTCNLSIRRSAVLRAGGFDPEFPYPMQDDIELGFRLWKLGTGVIYHPEIECSHRHPMNYW